MPTNPVTSGLTAYVEQSRDLLIKKLLFGKGSRSKMSIQTGVKKLEDLHILDVDPVFGDGSACGFNAAGTITVAQRQIETAAIVVDMQFCPKNLVGTYAEYLTRTAADENPIPWEEYLWNGIVDGINRKIEKLIWLGDVTQTTDPVLKWTDGLITRALASITASTGVVGVSLTGLNAYDGVMAVANSLTENVLERGGMIFVSPVIFANFVQSLVNLNLYHYNPGAPTDEVEIPGRNIVVYKTAGLAGDLHILGTYGRNLVYGTDGENDEERVKVWFSDDNDAWRFKVEFKAGDQIAFLDQVVLGTFNAAPAAVPGVYAGINAVAAAIGTGNTSLGTIASVATDVHNTTDKAIQTKDVQ